MVKGEYMFRILICLFLMTSPAFAVTQWNVNLPSATDLKSNWPTVASGQWNIIDSLVSNYRQGLYLTYASSSTLTMGVGTITVSTAGAQPRLFLMNTSSSTLTTANLDTGSSFTASTTYYIYAGASSSTAASATGYISLSNTAPAGVTYYAVIGQFTTDSNGNIAQIQDYAVVVRVGARTSINTNTIYQAQTDGIVSAGLVQPSNQGNIQIYSDSNPSPGTSVGQCSSYSNVSYCGAIAIIRKGDYYKVVPTIGSSGSINYTWWQPLGQ